MVKSSNSTLLRPDMHLGQASEGRKDPSVTNERRCVLPDIWEGVCDCPVRAQKEESGPQSFRGKLENFFCHFSHPAL